MPIRIAHDARPQMRTLLFAVALSVLLWFIPFADVLTYPFRLFVTFMHEGGHALATVLTGNTVLNLTVRPDGSGVVNSLLSDSLFTNLIVSSAGYLGAMLYGALLLVLIRRSTAARYVLTGSAAFILVMTLGYGWNPFTLASGITLAALLLLTAKFASRRVASFLVSFLAVQCVLNAIFDLKTVFFMSSPFSSGTHSDAVNMANATGIPAIFWTLVWIIAAFLILRMALLRYSANSRTPMQEDLPFEDPLDVPSE